MREPVWQGRLGPAIDMVSPAMYCLRIKTRRANIISEKLEEQRDVLQHLRHHGGYSEAKEVCYGTN